MSSRMLAIDTSGSVTAVAVLEGDKLLAEDCEPAGERHAEILLPRIQHCLDRAGLRLGEIDVYAVGVGPGSFTGVRVGVATVKGLALATGKPVRGVISLAALAACAPAESATRIAPILDAYKGEVFAAVYRLAAGEPALLVEPFHAPPEVAAVRVAEALEGEPACVLGSGYRRYETQLQRVWSERGVAWRGLDSAFDVPSARQLGVEALRLLRTEGPSDLARLAPLYVRGSDAQLPKQPLRV